MSHSLAAFISPHLNGEVADRVMQSAGLNHEQKSCPVSERLHGLQGALSSELQWQQQIHFQNQLWREASLG